MPIVVYDEGNTRDTKYAKFNLRAVLKVKNTNGYDINLNEIKLYGISKDYSGKYHDKKGKPIYYNLNVAGIVNEGSKIIRSHSSELVKCNIARFENDQEPGIMYGRLGLKTGYYAEGDGMMFYIYLPSFNQLFKYNERRIPLELVPEVYDGKLSFAINFNNELIKINPQKITKLVSSNNKEWENNEFMAKLYNATINMYK
jgi:hypothetical protein